MEPYPPSPKPIVTLAPTENPLPEPLLAAAMEVLAEHGEGGGTLGFPLMHLKMTVLGGRVHETESNELAFRLAAADAFNRGLREAGIVLLGADHAAGSDHARGKPGRHRRATCSSGGRSSPARSPAAATR